MVLFCDVHTNYSAGMHTLVFLSNAVVSLKGEGYGKKFFL